jgi:hypothetical protein
MAFIVALFILWASIREITPQPVPMSNIDTFSFVGHQAPNNTPSVPTFIGEELSSTENCLKLNMLSFRL